MECTESMQPSSFAIARAQVMDFLKVEPKGVVTNVGIRGNGFNQDEVCLTRLTVPKPQRPRS